jgi:predicted branched-subunit amino acid permease
LTDETFAIVVGYEAKHPDSPYRHWYQAGSSVGMYLNWNFWTIVGIIAGTSVQGLGSLGLDFAMVVTFIGIVVPLVVNRPMLACALAAGVTALLTYSLPNNLYLIASAIVGIAAGVMVERMKGKTA